MSRTYKSEGIVLKRFNYSEADRIVTIFTKEYGKVAALAKGVRRLQSKKAGSIEPASRAVFFFARGKSLDILTQTQLIQSYQHTRHSMIRLVQVNQLLEVVDVLTADKQENTAVYQLLARSLSELENQGAKKTMLLQNIRQILQELGFTYDKKFSEHSLKSYIEELAQRRLKSKNYLTPTFKVVDFPKAG